MLSFKYAVGYVHKDYNLNHTKLSKKAKLCIFCRNFTSGSPIIKVAIADILFPKQKAHV